MVSRSESTIAAGHSKISKYPDCGETYHFFKTKSLEDGTKDPIKLHEAGGRTVKTQNLLL